eukprot:TRINITY_DN3381_c0_g1_i5.p1 TRINITY_DN3381_c0_g1~~TRINITY_DN3381_c0_g1_i5.p1  ORF type:complete len:903 (-),score=300.11 TRINITY_DN3381_c0_g1_i5:54-2762(-)
MTENIETNASKSKRTGGFFDVRASGSHLDIQSRESPSVLPPKNREKSHTDPGRNSKGEIVVSLPAPDEGSSLSSLSGSSSESDLRKTPNSPLAHSNSKDSTSSSLSSHSSSSDKSAKINEPTPTSPRQIAEGKLAAIPKKTASFMKWAKNLTKFQSKEVALEDVSFDESLEVEDISPKQIVVDSIDAVAKGLKGSRLTLKITVQSEFNQIHLLRNYRHLTTMHKDLEDLFQLKDKAVPWPSKYDVNSFRPNQFAPQLGNYKRQIQEYFNNLIDVPGLASSIPFLQFINPHYLPFYKEVGGKENSKEGALKAMSGGFANNFNIMTKNKGGYIGGWSERWVVLTDKFLYCYKTMNEHSIPKQSIHLHYHVVEPSSNTKDVFEIKSLMDDKTYTFKAKDENERIEWIKKIRASKSPKLYKGGVHAIITDICDVLVQSVYYDSDPFSFQQDEGEHDGQSLLFCQESPTTSPRVLKPSKSMEQTKSVEVPKSETSNQNVSEGKSIQNSASAENVLEPSSTTFEDRKGFLEDAIEQDRIKREAEKSNEQGTPPLAHSNSQANAPAKVSPKPERPPSVTIGGDVIIDTDRNRIKAASKETLLEKLNEEQQDMDFVLCFLLTYRSFTTPLHLMNTCINRFTSIQANLKAEEKVNPTQLRICTVLAKWIEMNITDFDDNISQKLITFISEELETNAKFRVLAKKIRDAIRKKVTSGKKHNTAKPPKIELPYAFDGHFEYYDIPPIEIARQMALIEFAMFRKISPLECLNIKEREKNSPNLTSVTARFNNVSAWVQTEILKGSDVKVRAAALTRFIEIASCCISINNFNSAMEICAGLNSTPVYRLRKTWALLTPQTMSAFGSLQNLLGSERGYRAYRDAVHTIQPPIVPYLGVFLTDLIFGENFFHFHHSL